MCGQPIGAEGYHTFYLGLPDGKGRDMMIGSGCVRDRIRAEEVDAPGEGFMDIWHSVQGKFPTSGSWYGTFLHHCIAKPYVRDSSVAKRWDESVLGLPGARYVMGLIDQLRDEGYALDAEVSLDCGQVDLLATHPEKGDVVFDWKSDVRFDNHGEYVAQVSRYLSELRDSGHGDIMGYIVWVRDGRLEPVVLSESETHGEETPTERRAPSAPVSCSLTVDLDGGEGVRGIRRTAQSRRRAYGDEVSFYFQPGRPEKTGYEFLSYEASPYRVGGALQAFDGSDADGGFSVSFICSEKRRAFRISAQWKKVRPAKCRLLVFSEYMECELSARPLEYTDDGGVVEFDVDEINGLLGGRVTYARIEGDLETEGAKKRRSEDELHPGMKIRLPFTDESTTFMMTVRAKRAERKTIRKDPAPVGTEAVRLTAEPLPEPEMRLVDWMVPASDYDPAENMFTPGRIYKSSNRYFGIYKRRASDRNNAIAKVDVA